MAGWEMPFFYDKAADREQSPELWDQTSAEDQARYDRLDAEDAAFWAARQEPSPSEAEMAAARAAGMWAQGMEAQPYRVGDAAESHVEWQRAAQVATGEGRAR